MISNRSSRPTPPTASPLDNRTASPPAARSAAIVLSALLVGFLAPAEARAGTNLLVNPGFETGTAPWVAWAGATIEQTDQTVFAGSYAGRVSNRTEVWQGAVQPVPPASLEPGRSYRIRVQARITGQASAPLTMTIALEDDDGLAFRRVIDSQGFDDRWIELDEVYTHRASGTLTRFDFYVSGPPAGIDVLVDEARFEPLPLDWKSEADARIEQLRKRDIEIRVVDGQGQPVESAQVQVEQLARDFPIGTVMAAGPLENEPQYRDYISEHFNWTVHENAVKWYATEPTQGALNYSNADTMLAWAESEGLKVRGHTIFWAPVQWQPNWLPGLNDTELQAEVEDRLEDVVARYRGRFAHWDVNNEMLAGSFYIDRLGPGIRRWMFDRARQIDPGAELFVNEFNVVSSNSTDSYVDLVRSMQDDGFPIDGIGAQGHFTDVDPWAVKVRLDKLAALGKPVWITEFDVVQADENDRADALEAFFRTAYSHPAVEGIMLWGFWAGSHWRGPEAALVDLDWTINAAGQRFEQLMSEWWSHETAVTGLDGSATTRLFHGRYRITVDAAGHPTRVLDELVPAGDGLQLIVVNLDGVYADSFESAR